MEPARGLGAAGLSPRIQQAASHSKSLCSGRDLPGKRPMPIPRRHHIKTIYATRFLDVQTRYTDAMKKIL